MLDTIVIFSPDISDSLAKQIELRMEKKYGYDFENERLMYEMTCKQLQGSFDNRIRVNINRKKWVTTLKDNGEKYTDLKDCNPFLEIELSLHKFFLGHNAFGGSDDLNFQVSKVVQWLGEYFSADLPDYKDWTIKRIDYARIYRIKEIKKFIFGFNNAYYPRRPKYSYSVTGLYFPGTYTTLKIYDKEEEFKVHDKKKLKKVMDLDMLRILEKHTKNIMRIEIEVKGRKLKHIYGDLPKIKELNMKDIKDQFEIELKRIFKYKEDREMKLYNKNENVKDQLYKNYNANIASTLYGFWFALSVNGYDEMRTNIPKSTFYRYIIKLKDVGIVWNNTDVSLTNNIDFVFNPLDSDLEITYDLIAA